MTSSISTQGFDGHIADVLKDVEHAGLVVPSLYEIYRTGYKETNSEQDSSSPHHPASSNKLWSATANIDDVGGDVVGLCFESFLENLNHTLFLFSETDLRRNLSSALALQESEQEQDLSTQLYIVLALGAKYGGLRAGQWSTEWYNKARMRLSEEADSLDDLSVMRLLTLFCMLAIDHDSFFAKCALSQSSSRLPLNISNQQQILPSILALPMALDSNNLSIII